MEILPYLPEEDREDVETVLRAGLRDQERYASELTPPEHEGFVDEWWRRLREALEHGPEGCWVAVEQDHVIGFMWTSLVREWPFPYMIVDQLDVHVAMLLLECVHDEARIVGAVLDEENLDRPVLH